MRFKKLLHMFGIKPAPAASAPVPVPVAVPVRVQVAVPVRVPVPASKPANRRGRPISARLAAAIEAIAVHPDITPAEFAGRIGVTRGYAATLLRRARGRAQDSSAPVETERVQTVPERIREMSCGGAQAQQIAAELQVSRAEVDFVLKLQQVMEAAA